MRNATRRKPRSPIMLAMVRCAFATSLSTIHRHQRLRSPTPPSIVLNFQANISRGHFRRSYFGEATATSQSNGPRGRVAPHSVCHSGSPRNYVALQMRGELSEGTEAELGDTTLNALRRLYKCYGLVYGSGRCVLATAKISKLY
jgi:hypothetical protein